MDEHALLHEYRVSGSQEIFRRLVDRYIDLVYATARQVRDAHLAEDVTQAVFLLLAKKAGSVPQDRPLSAWLHRSACYVAANARRSEASRRKHEQRSTHVNANAESDSRTDDDRDWEAISPLLDEGISGLHREDRDAILLKFFERKTHREIGDALGVSEEAAAKRVSRAVDRLRGFFRGRGITASSVVVGGFLAAQATEAAPAGLAAMVTGGIAAGSVAGSSLLKGAIMFTTMQKLKVAIFAGVVLVLGVGGGVVAVKSLTSAADQSSSTTAPTQAQTAWPVRFSDGTEIEVLGIAISSPDAAQWWAVDGSDVPVPDFRINGQMSIVPSRIKRVLQVVLKTTGLQVSEKRLVVRADSDTGSGSLMVPDTAAQLFKAFVTVPDKPTFNLRLGLAGGTWTDTVLWEREKGAIPQPADATIIFANIDEADRQTQVQLRWGARPGAAPTPERPEMPAGRVGGAEGFGVGGGGVGSTGGGTGRGRFTTSFRPGGASPVLAGIFAGSQQDQSISAISGQRRIAPVGWQGSGGEVTVTFPCAMNEIEKLVLSSRPFEWMEIQNVSTMPADVPTNVKVGPAKEPATRPAIKETIP